MSLFLKSIFTKFRIQDWHICSHKFKDDALLFSGLPFFWWGFSYHLYFYHLVCNMSFFSPLCLLSQFSVFGFQKFHYDTFKHDFFFVFILSVGFCVFSISKFMFFLQFWEKSGHCFFKYFVCTVFSLLVFWYTNYT